MKPQVPLLPELFDVFKPSGLLVPMSSNANIKCHPISSNAIFFNDLSTYGLSYYDLSACVIIVYALSSYAPPKEESDILTVVKQAVTVLEHEGAWIFFKTRTRKYSLPNIETLHLEDKQKGFS